MMRNDDSYEELSSSTDNEEPKTQKKKFVYQRAEDWDREMKNRDKGSMSWEERVQWEGQMNGNEFRQNEILRHHLKGF